MSIKATRGQFFTVNEKVQDEIIKLIGKENFNNENIAILEPSVGAGDLALALFNKQTPNHPNLKITGWEIDENIKQLEKLKEYNFNLINGDFFQLSKNKEESFNIIFGNPPFVAWKNIEKPVQENITELMGKQTGAINLYTLFIEKCIELLKPNGELVFIVPKEWLYMTSAEKLRKKIIETGKITNIINCGEEKLFPDADIPALIIFKFVKNDKSLENNKETENIVKMKNLNNKQWEEKILKFINNGFLFINKDLEKIVNTDKVLGDYFDAKVGVVSGADNIYRIDNKELIEKFEKEGTIRNVLTTKGIEKFIWVENYSDFSMIPINTRNYLLEHKDSLINRKSRKFNDSNWWKWGAIRNLKLMENSMKPIYLYNKTRSTEPFFLNEHNGLFSGALLALYPKEDLFTTTIQKEDYEKIVKLLNSDTYRKLFEAMGLTTGNKITFQPTTLNRIPFNNDYINEIEII